MESGEVLAALVELAREAGIEVRRLRAGGGGEGEAPAASGVCRLRGAVWVVLADTDPLEDRIGALALALQAAAPAWLENRFLPPAVRDRLDGAQRPI